MPTPTAEKIKEFERHRDEVEQRITRAGGAARWLVEFSRVDLRPPHPTPGQALDLWNEAAVLATQGFEPFEVVSSSAFDYRGPDELRVAARFPWPISPTCIRRCATSRAYRSRGTIARMVNRSRVICSATRARGEGATGF